MGEKLSPDESRPERFGKLDVPEIRRSIEELREGVQELSADLEEGRAFLEEDQKDLTAMLEYDTGMTEEGFPSPALTELIEKTREDVRRTGAMVAQIEELKRSLEAQIEEFQESNKVWRHRFLICQKARKTSSLLYTDRTYFALTKVISC